MKYLFVITALALTITVSAQQKQTAPAAKPKEAALPMSIYNALRDSCNGMDITFLLGAGGSMSLDNRNVRMFTSFVSTAPGAKKESLPQAGLIMWEVNGREYLTGNLYFSGDSAGYVLFNKNNREYVNALTKQGAGFLMTNGKIKK